MEFGKMTDRVISTKELLLLIRNKWLAIVLVSGLIFASIFLSNYLMFKNVNNNAFFTKEIDLYVDIAKTKELKEVAEEVVRSETFYDAANDKYGIVLSENFIDSIVYGQTYYIDQNSSIHIVKILSSSKSLDEIEDFETVLIDCGKKLLEKEYGSTISIRPCETTRIVAGEGANFNLASPYDMYVEMHEPTAQHILLWLSMSVLLGFAIVVLLILFRYKKDNDLVNN